MSLCGADDRTGADTAVVPISKFGVFGTIIGYTRGTTVGLSCCGVLCRVLVRGLKIRSCGGR